MTKQQLNQITYKKLLETLIKRTNNLFIRDILSVELSNYLQSPDFIKQEQTKRKQQFHKAMGESLRNMLLKEPTRSKIKQLLEEGKNDNPRSN